MSSTSFSAEGILISGELLIDLARQGVQIIDGEPIAYRGGEEVRWLVIRAVDSTWWDVETDDEEVLTRIQAAFPAAMKLPQ
jgi:hypothetical protein